MIQETGKCRAIRQDGDSTMVINEAIDTCPVDCIHWISFEELIAKKEEEKARAAY
jgi:ferredoxin